GNHLPPVHFAGPDQMARLDFGRISVAWILYWLQFVSCRIDRGLRELFHFLRAGIISAGATSTRGFIAAEALRGFRAYRCGAAPQVRGLRADRVNRSGLGVSRFS